MMKPYTHFSVDERLSLQLFLKEQKSLRNIATLLCKNVSSISREIKRNANKSGKYNFWRATSLYIYRRKKSVRRMKLKTDKNLTSFVTDKLKLFWSPQAICARWKRDTHGSKISPTTIYHAIKKSILPDVSAKKHLRRRGKHRAKKSLFNTIKPDNLIRDWEDVIVNRTRLGDWEGDTVHGGIGKGGVVTFIDRKSRELVVKLISNFSAVEIKHAILHALKGKIVNSISLDNGSEFAEHKKIHEELGVKIYFADPHSPWQRASNENANGILRFFFPKGCDFHAVTQYELDVVVSLINNRPRKCLDWLSPIEFLTKCCT